MLVEWMHWLTSLRITEIVSAVGVLLLTDAPRYALGSLAMALCDTAGEAWHWLRGRSGPGSFDYCPAVCVLLVGHNEADTVGATLESVWGTYPRMEIVVVDDGSTDGMADVARRFARSHAGVLVLSRPERGGKSSALNFGLRYVTADVVICIDTDSRLGPHALWEIVQPLADPHVAAVGATIKVWNARDNLLTWLQGYEYRQCIFIGRMLLGRLGLLGIVSGAFGAFRREVLEQLGGWDAGSGEDGDLTLRIRQAGHRIAFAPYAVCLTKAPTTWRGLYRQRLRWDRSVITFECRKYADLACPWSRNFRWSNCLLVLDRWFFNIVCVLTYCGFFIWLALARPHSFGHVALLLYLCQMCLELIQVATLLYYSDDRRDDLILALVVPLVPAYQFFIKFTDLVALLDETFLRKSFADNYVPRKVRDATWHW